MYALHTYLGREQITNLTFKKKTDYKFDFQGGKRLLI